MKASTMKSSVKCLRKDSSLSSLDETNSSNSTVKFAEQEMLETFMVCDDKRMTQELNPLKSKISKLILGYSLS